MLTKKNIRQRMRDASLFYFLLNVPAQTTGAFEKVREKPWSALIVEAKNNHFIVLNNVQLKKSDKNAKPSINLAL